MNLKQRALQQLNSIANAPNNVLIIHYSCESFNDKPDGSSPRISSIAIKDFDSSQTYSFSIHHTAEITKTPKSEIEKHYDSLEKQMLDEFFAFLSKYNSHIFVHWNMRNATYGFQAIYHRYRVLGGDPIQIDESRLFDLGRAIGDIYGSNYANHPKMENLIDQNSITKRHFLKGAEEAEAFIKKEYYRLHLSTLRKVDAFSEILEKQINGTLKTKQHPVVAKIQEYHGHWAFQLAELLLAIIGLASTINIIISLIIN